MRFKGFFPAFLLLFICCGYNTESIHNLPKKGREIKDSLKIESDPTKIDTLALKINFKPGINYSTVKLKSAALKKSLLSKTDSILKFEFENYLLNEIIPFWYKTPWDFSGYTDVPGHGVVACGYFVSTVMKHAGFNVNRYKLAQQNPLNEAKSLASNDSVAIYEATSTDLQKIFIDKYPEGLYFVGLDFHVGFLLFRNRELYFIHSNYINSEGVIFEKAIYSDAFNASTSYRIAGISTNKDLLQKWMKGSEIIVQTSKRE